MNSLEKDVELIEKSGLFDRKWYQSEYPDVTATRLDPIEHFLKYGARLQRNPSLKFNSRRYLKSNPDSSNVNPLVHYLLHGKHEGRHSSKIIAREKTLGNATNTLIGNSDFEPTNITSSATKHESFVVKTKDMHGTEVALSPAPCFGSTDYEIDPKLSGPCVVLPFDSASTIDILKWPKIGIHLHLFYIDLLDEIIFFIANIPAHFDLYVSVVDATAIPLVSGRLSQMLPRASVHVRSFENKGRDISHFVVGFSKELLQHDLVCHIHSKRSLHNKNKSDWRRQLLVNLFGSQIIVEKIVGLFMCNPHIGLVFPEYHHSLRGQISWGTNYGVCKDLAQTLNMVTDVESLALFPAGSMFWSRGSALSTLLDAGLEYSDFPPEQSQIDGTLAHAVERLLGEVVTQAGYEVIQVKSSKQHNLIFYYPQNWVYKPSLTLDKLASLTHKYRNNLVRRKAKVVIYTALSGKYEQPLPYEHLDSSYDYVLFSDNPVSNCGFWDVRPMDYWHPESVRMARYIKTHPHKCFSEYDTAVWIDANVVIKGDLSKYLKLLDSSHSIPLAGIPHPQRNCIYEEAEILVKVGKDNTGRVERQIEGYRKKAYPKNNGLIETNFLIIDLKCTSTDKIMNDWWTELDKFSHRDQLSLNYALWKNGAEWRPLMSENISLRDNLDFAYFGHGKNSGYPEEYLTGGNESVDPYARSSLSSEVTGVDDVGVDIVVCVHNALEEVKECLASVVDSMRGVDRLIIVDDVSNNKTASYLDKVVESQSNVILLRHDGNANGYSVSANKGMAESTAGFVLLLNSDTVLCRNALEKMLKVAISSPGVGVVGPLSNAASTQSIPRIRASSNQTAVNELPKGITVEELDKWCEESSYRTIFPSVPLIHGFCQLINRRVIETIGGFDEEAFPFGYGEENDFCFRATNAGFDLKVATNAFVYHKKSASYCDSGRRGELMQRGAAKLKEKHSEDRLRRAIKTMEGHPMLVRMREQAEAFYEVAPEECAMR